LSAGTGQPSGAATIQRVEYLSPGAAMLHRVDEKFFKFETLLNYISALVIMGIMVMGTVQVIGRVVFSTPIYGYSDMIEQIMCVFAFLAIAYTQRLGGHVRMELLLGRMSGRVLYFFEIVGTVAAIGVIIILAYYGYTHFLRAFEIGDSTIDVDLPIWPSKLMVPLAFSVMLVRLFIQLIGFVRLFMYPNEELVGVPRMETVDDLAQAEIDAGLAGEGEKVDIVNRGGERT